MILIGLKLRKLLPINGLFLVHISTRLISNFHNKMYRMIWLKGRPESDQEELFRVPPPADKLHRKDL